MDHTNVPLLFVLLLSLSVLAESQIDQSNSWNSADNELNSQTANGNDQLKNSSSLLKSSDDRTPIKNTNEDDVSSSLDQSSTKYTPPADAVKTPFRDLSPLGLIAAEVEEDFLRDFRDSVLDAPSDNSLTETTKIYGRTADGLLQVVEDEEEKDEIEKSRAKGKIKLGQECTSSRKCENYPKTRCTSPKIPTVLDRLVCSCNLQHTEINKTCVLNVFSPCTDVDRNVYPCGKNMHCGDDPLGKNDFKCCRCNPGFFPMQNEDEIPAFCVKDDIVAKQEHKDYRGTGTVTKNAVFLLLVSSFTATLFQVPLFSF